MTVSLSENLTYKYNSQIVKELKMQFSKFETTDKHITINRFPINTFIIDLKARFRTHKIARFLTATGMKILGYQTVKIHKFFIPELIFILENFPQRLVYSSILQYLKEKTWFKQTEVIVPRLSDFSKIDENMEYKLNSYQKEFITIYNERKVKYLLNGYILAFEQGLGKTFTSLALMESLSKEYVIIIAPKSTLSTVWYNEIEKVYKEKQNIWVVNTTPPKTVPRFFIVNYESIEKLNHFLHHFVKSTNIGIIVDESHNFKEFDAKRTKMLLNLYFSIKCNDILLLSGTPIKALGKEMISVLKLLDPLFDKEAQEAFLLSFGFTTEFALEILKNRLGMLMHRKTKTEVLNLPPKNEYDLKIKIPKGNYYTLDNVKVLVYKFIVERNEYYKREKQKYVDMFEEVIEHLQAIPELAKSEDFKHYLKIVERLKKYGYIRSDRHLVKLIKWANDYEKTVLYPLLTSDLKKKFMKSKSVVKYVNLKIMGEVIGGLLNQLRAEMFSSMIEHSGIENIIKTAIKKTICFTTYKDVALNADIYLKSKKFHTALIYGDTSGDIVKIFKEFKKSPKLNPLIATIQTMSTGVTLIDANTIIFLNKPWRFTDYQQASDRVHRIGQDTEVNIYSMILDTGNKQNLSTRMEDIVKWSKDMFEGIVGEVNRM